MKILVVAAFSIVGFAAAEPAMAQSYYGQNDYGQGSYDRGYSAPRSYDRSYDSGSRRWAERDFQGQRDVPGDYRCDAYWDRGRTDCDAGWRDQRRYSSRGPQGSSHSRGYSSHGRYGHGYGSGQGATAYHGAYGRPDLVYPSGGHGGGYGSYGRSGARDPHRIDWCRATYRSYDPGSGFYRAYSGRLIYCG